MDYLDFSSYFPDQINNMSYSKINESEAHNLTLFMKKFLNPVKGVEILNDLSKKISDNPESLSILKKSVNDYVQGAVVLNGLSQNDNNAHAIRYVVENYSSLLDEDSQKSVRKQEFAFEISQVVDAAKQLQHQKLFDLDAVESFQKIVEDKFPANIRVSLSYDYLSTRLDSVKLLYQVQQELNQNGALSDNSKELLWSYFPEMQLSDSISIMQLVDYAMDDTLTKLAIEICILQNEDNKMTGLMAEVLNEISHIDWNLANTLAMTFIDSDLVNTMVNQKPALVIQFPSVLKRLNSTEKLDLNCSFWYERILKDLSKDNEPDYEKACAALSNAFSSKGELSNEESQLACLLLLTSLQSDEGFGKTLIEVLSPKDLVLNLSLVIQDIQTREFFTNQELVQALDKQISIFQNLAANQSSDYGIELAKALVAIEEFSIGFAALKDFNLENFSEMLVPMFILATGALQDPAYAGNKEAQIYANDIISFVEKNAQTSKLNFLYAVYNKVKNHQANQVKSLIVREILASTDTPPEIIITDCMEIALNSGDMQAVLYLLENYKDQVASDDAINAFLQGSIVIGRRAAFEYFLDKLDKNVFDEQAKDLFRSKFDFAEMASNKRLSVNDLITYYEQRLLKEPNKHFEEILINLYLRKGDFESVEKYRQFRWGTTIQEMHQSLISVDMKGRGSLNIDIFQTILSVGSMLERRKAKGTNYDEVMKLIFASLNNNGFNKACGTLFEDATSVSESKLVDFLEINGLDFKKRGIRQIARGLEFLRSLSFKSKFMNDAQAASIKAMKLIDLMDNGVEPNKEDKLTLFEYGSIDRFQELSQSYKTIVKGLKKAGMADNYLNENEALLAMDNILKVTSSFDFEIFDNQINAYYKSGDILLHDDVIIKKMKGEESLSKQGYSIGGFRKAMTQLYKSKNPFAVQPYFTGRYSHAGYIYKDKDDIASLVEVVGSFENSALNLEEIAQSQIYRPNVDRILTEDAKYLLQSQGIDPQSYFDTIFKSYTQRLIDSESEYWDLSNSEYRAVGAWLKSTRFGLPMTKGLVYVSDKVSKVAGAINSMKKNENSLFGRLIPQPISGLSASVHNFFTDKLKAVNEQILGEDSSIYNLELQGETKMFCSEFTAIMLLKSLDRLNQSLIKMAESRDIYMGGGDMVNFPISMNEDLSAINPNVLYDRISTCFERLEPPREVSMMINFDT